MTNFTHTKYIHTFAWCLLEYFHFIFDDLILFTYMGGEKEGEMEKLI